VNFTRRRAQACELGLQRRDAVRARGRAQPRRRQVLEHPQEVLDLGHPRALALVLGDRGEGPRETAAEGAAEGAT
jgi:hypothetical protein